MRFVTRHGRPSPGTLALLLALPLFLVATYPLLKVDLSRLGGFAEMARGLTRPIDWTYLPSLLKLCAETLGMAFVATVFAVLISLPFSLLAARNTTPARPVGGLVKSLFSVVRAVPDMVWAAMLASAVGIGVLPGVLALIVSSVAFMVKVFAESFEVVDPKPIEGVIAHGASPLAVRTFAIVPQAVPDLLGLSLYILDVNVRAASILGLVGAGGIGFDLTTAIRLQYWDRLLLIIVAVYLMVTLIDRLSAYLRARLLQ